MEYRDSCASLGDLQIGSVPASIMIGIHEDETVLYFADHPNDAMDRI